MKSKIRLRLMLYFAVAFIVFSLIIGAVFSVLFSKHNMNVHKNELTQRASSIAYTLSDFYNGSIGQGMMRQGQGYGAYMRFIEDIAMSDVWIVDQNQEQISRGHGQRSLPYKDLPVGAEDVISQALNGETSFSESFGAFLGTPTITVATPISISSGDVIGVVLLHSQIDDVSSTTMSGLLILISSMAVAIVLSFFVASALSANFTKPLGKMKSAALQISEGNYLTRTNVIQADEIGELAFVIDNMANTLDLASQESAKLEKLRRDFIANISHELRTPVTVIRGSLEALCDGVVTEPKKVNEYHNQMLLESIHLERLVSDLLDLAKLQNPDFSIEMRTVDLKELTTDALRGMKRIAEGKNVRLQLTCTGENFSVSGDYDRLRQMLIIVLDNAIKFSPQNSMVDIAITNTNGMLEVIIRDRGCGIEQSELPHIFERFYKQRSEENKSGTGLGLAIVKQIADRHDVSVVAKNCVDTGAEFTFLFCETAD